MVGKEDNHTAMHSRQVNASAKVSMVQDLKSCYFPFKQGYLFVATVRVGSEGVQMTVDGKHVSSFGFREVSSSLCIIYFCRKQQHSSSLLSYVDLSFSIVC